MNLGRLLGGKPYRRSNKIIDGQHTTNDATHFNGSALKPDLLPLSDEQNGNGAHGKRGLLVAVTGSDLDREVMTLACKVAQEKKAPIFAVYGIEVPRTKAIDDEMPTETEKAHQALDCVATVAQQLHMVIEPEIVQSRHFGHSLVDEAEAHDCALLIMGLPYRIGVGGQIEGTEALEYVLRSAPCKVWVVRGLPQEKTERSAAERANRLERSPVVR